MKRQLIGQAMLAAALCVAGASLQARTLYAPLTLKCFVPLQRTDEGMWEKWGLDFYGIGWHRTACETFTCDHGTDLVPLTQLYFNQAAFFGKEIFANNMVSTPGQNTVGLQFARITPKVTADQDGVLFRADLTYNIGEGGHWRIGARAALPFHRTEVKLDDCCDLEEEFGPNICSRRNEHALDLPNGGMVNNMVNGLTDEIYNQTYAYRLDFLTALFSGEDNPLVQFVANNGISIAGIQIGNQAGDADQKYATHVIRRNDETLPDRFAATQRFVNTQPDLNGNGQAPAGNDDDRARINSTVDYNALAGDNATQRTLYIVPTAQNPANTTINTDAGTIRDEIRNALDQSNVSGVDFLKNDCNISFASEKVVGIGDFTTDFFLSYDFSDKWTAELTFGVLWPTGDRNREPNRLFFMSRGNNGHFEFLAGYEMLWRPIDWFNARAYLSFHHAAERTEKVAASFEGAAIKNINPTVEADIDWSYFIGRMDWTFRHPECPELGFNLAYEAYVKGEDNVVFCTQTGSNQTTVDCQGVEQKLDPNVLERRTDQVGHRIITEIFHHFDCGGLFIGWSHIVGGRNIPRETMWYLGMQINY